MLPPKRILAEQGLFLLIGTLLGLGLRLVGGPMPFLFGGILAAGGLVAWFEHREGPAERKLPAPFRMFFVALAGAMIGATFSPDLMAVIPDFWVTALGVLVFLMVAHSGSYWIMRKVGRFPPVDALYAAMPGGLVEASILGEAAGADPKALAIQHFIRVLLVVLTVPTLFWIVTGQAVGSSAGQDMSPQIPDASDVALLTAVAVVGQWIGQRMRVPAGHLMGPLLVCGALHAVGVIEVAVPTWLLNLAQLVIGVALGAQISGLTGAMLIRGLKAGVVSVGYMLCISLLFALALRPVAPTTVEVLFLAFAPGGVTEMSLIALSLQVSPVIVALHHMVRIIASVMLTQAASHLFRDRLRKD